MLDASSESRLPSFSEGQSEYHSAAATEYFQPVYESTSIHKHNRIFQTHREYLANVFTHTTIKYVIELETIVTWGM